MLHSCHWCSCRSRTCDADVVAKQIRTAAEADAWIAAKFPEWRADKFYTMVKKNVLQRPSAARRPDQRGRWLYVFPDEDGDKLSIVERPAVVSL